MINFDHRVETLKGVGSVLGANLAKLGITTIGDLVNHYPRRYDDFSQLLPIRAMRPGPVTVRGQIERIASRRARGRKMSITEAIISDSTGTVKCIWFNQPFLAKTYPIGTEVLVAGELRFSHNDLALQSPAIERAEGLTVDQGGRHTGRIVPVYPETEGVTSKQLRSLIMPLVPSLDELPETLPPEIVKSAKLFSRGRTMQELHAPTSGQALLKARKRLAFEELFYLIAASLVIKNEIKTEAAPVIPLNIDVVKAATAELSFELTNAQRAAAWQILQDMTNEVPMNRMLQGDVGSGKTIVALLAACVAMKAGYQVALMVPTDILARQHAATLVPLLEKLGYKAGLLLARQKAADRTAAEQAVAVGELQLVIGTQALLTEKVTFANLGLVVVDEQHRFGVGQRQALKSKAGRLPHLLTMTATPIPRSLALTVYGDLDVSIMEGLPPGRQPIDTKVVKPSQRAVATDFIDAQIAEGRQVFVVCPLIEDSDTLGSKSVTTEAERLRNGVFKHRRIGILHGRLKPAEKDATMQAFADGELDILVTTTVIEVGIDVPNASVMLIEGAERFGLAALHQLRGRVGRGEHKSYCMLATDSTGAGVAERLQALERTNDGFRLAQIDLELRGPGAIYGLRQHGMLDLRVADLSDTKLIAQVREVATEFVADSKRVLQYPQVTERINRLKSITSLD